MILNEHGQSFEYDGTTYAIGDVIIGTDASEYEGLAGTIIEIRDGEDKETENETPDIYCSFEPPLLPEDVKALEETFSELYQEPKTIEDIVLDMVIMAPEMIIHADKCSQNARKIKLYAVTEDWANNDDEYGQSTTLFATKEAALKEFKLLLATEALNGIIADIKGTFDYVEEFSSIDYECYVDGFHEGNHYHAAVEEMELFLTPSSLEQMRKLAQDITYCADFIEQIEPWEELAEMSTSEYHKMITDPELPERIRKAIDMNDSYWDSYWQSISEVAHQIVTEAKGAGCNANPKNMSS